jgi:hypothetical protein
VEEAVAGLASWLERALAGEGIRIRKGDSVVELRPVPGDPARPPERVSPREALRKLQAEAHLTAEQARDYLEALREERLAGETRRPA